MRSFGTSGIQLFFSTLAVCAMLHLSFLGLGMCNQATSARFSACKNSIFRVVSQGQQKIRSIVWWDYLTLLEHILQENDEIYLVIQVVIRPTSE
jgi:hypothetical protein